MLLKLLLPFIYLNISAADKYTSVKTSKLSVHSEVYYPCINKNGKYNKGIFIRSKLNASFLESNYEKKYNFTNTARTFVSTVVCKLFKN